MKSTPTTKAPAVLDPQKISALQAKISRLVSSGALTAAPHTYHH
ncbi:hypothetical protein [Kitasatospora sp. NPDC094016]